MRTLNEWQPVLFGRDTPTPASPVAPSNGSTFTPTSLARQLQAGVVTVNDHLMSHGLPEAPWGGFKLSGIGRTHGRIGFDEMTQDSFVQSTSGPPAANES